jgi:phosphonate transport system substrate-binding protein
MPNSLIRRVSLLISWRSAPCLVGLCLALAALAPAHSQSIGIVRLRIGAVITSQFRPPAERLEPFRAYLAQQLAIPVEVQIFRNGQELVEAASRRRIDYAIFTGATYAAAWRMCGCFEPVVAAKSIDGTAGVRSILLVRGDSPFQSLDALKGKVLAAPDQRSVASRMVPVSELKAEGTDVATLFQRIDTVAGPIEAVQALLDRKADAALAWSTLEGEAGEGYDRGTLHDLVARHALDMHQVRILWRSGLIPNGPHAVREDLPLEFKTRLRDLLIELQETSPAAYEAIEPVFGGGFVPMGQSTYLPFLRLATPVGQDPMQPPVRTTAIDPPAVAPAATARPAPKPPLRKAP